MSSTESIGQIPALADRQPLFAHVELQKGERSELAETAANLM